MNTLSLHVPYMRLHLTSKNNNFHFLLQRWRNADTFIESIAWHWHFVDATRLQILWFSVRHFRNYCHRICLHTLQLCACEYYDNVELEKREHLLMMPSLIHFRSNARTHSTNEQGEPQ